MPISTGPLTGDFAMSDRLNVTLHRDPVSCCEVADRYSLTETDGGVLIADGMQKLYVHLDQAETLAYGLLQFLDQIESDKKRYVRLRDRVGRAVRQNLSEFEEVRIAIEVGAGNPSER